MVEELFVLEHLVNSDHNIITWKTTCETVINKNGNGVLISDDLEISEILNSYFGSVFTKENLSDKLSEVEQVFKGDLSSNLT